MLSRRPRDQALVTAYALLAAALFGINSSTFKVVVEAGLEPAQVTLMRVAATLALAGIWLALAGRQYFAVTRRDLGGFAVLFEYTAVILVALAAWLVFGERIGARLWWAIAAVLAGLALVSQIWDSPSRPLGIAASSGVLFAVAVAWVWLGESLTALQVAGSAVVFAGIVVAQSARESATAVLEPPALERA